MKVTTIFILVFVLVASAVAIGQESKAEVFGGWQFMSLDTKGIIDRQNVVKGWDADLALKLNKNVAIVGDFSGSYKDLGSVSDPLFGTAGAKLHVHNILFGPRFSVRAGRVTPFAEVLVGVARTSVKATVSSVDASTTTNGLGFAVGGGLDINAGRHFAFRLAKFDYMMNRINFNSSTLDLSVNENLNHFRVATGIVLKF